MTDQKEIDVKVMGPTRLVLCAAAPVGCRRPGQRGAEVGAGFDGLLADYAKTPRSPSVGDDGASTARTAAIRNA